MLIAAFLCILALTGCDTREYTVTIIQPEHATLSTEKTTYRKGETVVVSEVVEPGYSCSTEWGHISFYGSFEMPGSNVTISGKTYPRSYRIEYLISDDAGLSGTVSNYYTINDSVKLPYAYKAGYEFGGWYTDHELTKSITKIEAGTIGDIQLYPSFSQTTYEITYELPDGVTNDPNNPTSFTIESDELPLYDIEVEGCEFLGWYTSPSFKGSPLTAIPEGSFGNTHLYPKLVSRDYTEDGYRIIRNKLDLQYAFSYDEYDKNGKYLLKGDIEFYEGEENPSVSGFAGVFDGGGHSITNLNRALFNTVDGGTIENLSFSTVQSHTLKVKTDITRKIGGLVNSTYYDNGTSYIRNVRVISAKIDTYLLAPLNLGAIVGYAHGSGNLVIEKCLVENLDFNIFAAGSTSVGGILGEGKADISECAVRMDEDDRYAIECTHSKSKFYVGGIVGRGYNASVTNCYFRQESVYVDGFSIYASKYCVDVAIGGIMGYASFSSVISSYVKLSEINFESNAVSLTPIQIYMAGLIGYGSDSSITDSYVDSYSNSLDFNTNITKYGITMRFYMGYLACYFDDGVIYSRSRSMPSSIKAYGETISTAYIEDYERAFNTFGAAYDEIWNDEIWVHKHGQTPELIFLAIDE